MKRHRRTRTSARLLGLSAAVLSAAAVGFTYTDATGAAAPNEATERSTVPAAASTRTVRYDLGDDAWRLPQTGQPVELTGVVHYPADLGTGRHPLIVMLHGLHDTCADRKADAARTAAERDGDDAAYEAANAKLSAWPCASGTPVLPSERGYDYLGRELAAQGFVVVSVGANGINASSVWGDDNAAARADLINRHLRMWQELSSKDQGELSGKFTDPATGAARRVGFAHHVDMGDVGVMGHSRAGAGVTWQAADSHRGQWPKGVDVKAVAAVAPAYNVMTEDMSNYTITKTPFATFRGTCDGQVGGEALWFAADAAKGNRSGFYRFAIHGANHNYFNTQWSPRSRQVAASDDAMPVEGHPGQCTDREGAAPTRQLTEPQQRHVAVTYLGAFFRRHLLGDTGQDPVLTGARHPDAAITDVDVTTAAP
ncbi:alpha/beta hydrolase [Streptomyces tsukubensis]|uniref:Alpha/beta hydrolase n=1 Tax=Streptomyces tsukubensis TaxID=83656 RepID=A0A1V4AH64_9ACTN|nr:alpha/beta hydrolase [Streptomyces tsukubensis]OON83015.1 alpha/beta hydrolase [Streptomyces tsukubensis]QFR92116.1 alpha/beta hydrolase [Streptomyces tsukubensis]